MLHRAASVTVGAWSLHVISTRSTSSSGPGRTGSGPLRGRSRRWPLPSGSRSSPTSSRSCRTPSNHTRIDEQVLYPTAESRSGSPLAAASMAYDHLAIRSWIAKLAEADEGDVETLQELLYGLDALIRVHLWKEDELFVKPLSSSTWPASGA